MITILFLIHAALLFSHPEEAVKKELTPEAKEKLKERDRHGEEARKLQKEGKIQEAMAAARQKLAIEREVLGDLDDEAAGSLKLLAELAEEMADFESARKFLEEALQVKRKLHGEKDWRVAGGEFALKDLESRRKLGEREREELKEAKRLSGEAKSLWQQGKSREAHSLVEKALSIRERILGKDHPLRLKDLNRLASILSTRGELKEAEKLFREALEMRRRLFPDDHDNVADSLNNLGSLLYNRGELKEAEELSSQAVEMALSLLDWHSQGLTEEGQLGFVAKLRWRLDRYLEIFLLSRLPPRRAYPYLYRWKGQVSARQRNLRLARRHPELTALFQELESVSARYGALAFSKVDDANESKPGRLEALRGELSELAERRNAIERELSSRSAEYRKAVASRKLEPEEMKKLLPPGALLVDFVEYWSSTKPSRADGDDLKKSVETAAKKSERRLLAFLLPKQGEIALLDFGPMEPIERAVDAWRLLHAGDSGEKTRKKTGERGAGEEVPLDPERELARLLLEPLKPYLEGVSLLLISPDGALGRFPLAALPGRKPGSNLLEDLAIALLPVPQLLPELFEPPDQESLLRETLLLVGDVDYGAEPRELALDVDPSTQKKNNAEIYRGPALDAPRGGGLFTWGRLQSTFPEILAVGRIFKDSQKGGAVEELTEDKATESEVRRALSSCRYAHLATHGFFAEPQLGSALAWSGPAGGAEFFGAGFSGADFFGKGRFGSGASGPHPGLMSGIALSGANRLPAPQRHDGVLTALELSWLDLLGTELLVLSACDTGLGATAGGEGLLGLQRGAQIAGARAVVASLWKVPDTETMALMQGFYENLWKKRLPKLEALRQAQLEILRGKGARGPGEVNERPEARAAERASPRIWAAWTFSGDRR
ncbi:MAG: CHAT domain-containing protein [Planctomycetes bacterium]|nr:CHAT domain-containing protein [Planctomycetota bacterium]